FSPFPIQKFGPLSAPFPRTTRAGIPVPAAPELSDGRQRDRERPLQARGSFLTPAERKDGFGGRRRAAARNSKKKEGTSSMPPFRLRAARDIFAS
ncbi:MAG: hypothetical protein BJ554DRAFT_2596, partial [Olpidium bornovanus]